MQVPFLRHLRSNAVAYLALFVALGGTSFAAATVITGKNVKNGSLTGKDVKNSSLTGADLHAGAVNSGDVQNGSLLGQDFAPGELPQGAQGPKGDTGAKGDQGQPGTNGTNGTNGTDGTDGTDGVDGATGGAGYTGSGPVTLSTNAQGQPSAVGVLPFSGALLSEATAVPGFSAGQVVEQRLPQPMTITGLSFGIRARATTVIPAGTIPRITVTLFRANGNGLPAVATPLVCSLGGLPSVALGQYNAANCDGPSVDFDFNDGGWVQISASTEGTPAAMSFQYHATVALATG